MEIHSLDPDHTRSERARANFRLAVAIAAGFVALLWFIALLNWGVAPGLEEFGIRPREAAGLPGILIAPLLHSGFGHLLANSVPLIVLGAAMLYLYPRSLLRVLPVVWLGPGVAVWLFGSAGVHIGASGLVYGFAAYVFTAGVIRHDRRAIAAALVVAFLYGTLVWGVLPIERGVSWETHLAAGLLGVAMALALRRLDRPPLRRYSWESGPGSGDDEAPWFDETGVDSAPAQPSPEQPSRAQPPAVTPAPAPGGVRAAPPRAPGSAAQHVVPDERVASALLAEGGHRTVTGDELDVVTQRPKLPGD